MIAPAKAENRTRLTSCFHDPAVNSAVGSPLSPPLVSQGVSGNQFRSNSVNFGSSSGKLIPVSKKRACPICARTAGFCKYSSSSELVFCSQVTAGMKVKQVILGKDHQQWAFVGMDKGTGDWAKFVPHKEPAERVIPIQRPITSTPSVKALSVANRHNAFNLLHQTIPLHQDDAADLFRRGLTAEQIDASGAKTLNQGQRFKAPFGLPGFRYGRFTGGTGYWIPTRDWEGQITGGQVRLREAREDGTRYTWLVGCHLPSGELPLQIIKGDPSKPVFWIESTMAKPWIVHFQTGATVIGAAGGNFGSCESQVREILRNTAGQSQILLPDAGAIYNPHVLAQHDRLFQLIPSIQVRWWDQFHYAANDADENPAWQDGTDIPLTEWKDNLTRLQAEGLTFHFERQPDLKLAQRYLPSDLLTTHQSALDVVISGLGTGKTEALKAVTESAEQPVVVISRNRKTVRQICQRIGVPYVQEGRSDVIDDRDLTATWMRTKGFGTCSASIRPDSALRFNADHFKDCIVVLDEWDATASDAVLNFQTDIAKHRTKVMQSLSLLLGTASRVIALSGTMRQIDISLLEALTEQKAFVIHNDYKAAASRDLTAYTRESLLRAQTESHLKAGGSALVHTSDQKQSTWAPKNLFAAALKDTPLTEANSDFFDSDVTSNGSQRQRDLPRDADGVLKQLKAAYVSPVMAAGVSITLQDHFDQVTVYSGGHLAVADVVQMGARLRSNAPRHLYVPSASGSRFFGGETDWQKISRSAHQDAEKLDTILQLSRQEGTVLTDDPWFKYACQVYALQNLQSLHYRHLILEAYRREGYAVTVVDREPTKEEKVITQRHSELVEDANDKAAFEIAEAPMPSADDTDILPASRKKAQIVKVFGIEPDDLTAHHIKQADKALPALRSRLLFTDHEALAFWTLQRLEEAGGGDLDKVFVLDKARIGAKLLQITWIQSLLQQADALAIFNRSDWFNANDPMVQRIHRAVLEDPDAKKYIGSRFNSFKDPIRTVQALLAVFGFNTETRKGPRSNGQQPRQHSVRDSFHEFNPTQVLHNWRQDLSLLFQEPSGDGGEAEYP